MPENKNADEVQINLLEKLSNIQSEMVVPKNLYNSYSNFWYRNAEGILEFAKPICKKYRTVLTIQDDIVMIGERYYVKAIATLHDLDSDDYINNCSLAREQQDKKGMDHSQITGSTSSYARKYALNGLFDLDDTKDNDNDKILMQDPDKVDDVVNEKELPATPKQLSRIKDLYSPDEIADMESRKGKMDTWTLKLASVAIDDRAPKK